MRVKERFESGKDEGVRESDKKKRWEERESEERRDPCKGEREKPKINNGVRFRLDLKTEMISFVIFWTSLVFVQISRVVSEIYPNYNIYQKESKSSYLGNSITLNPNILKKYIKVQSCYLSILLTNTLTKQFKKQKLKSQDNDKI